jgi:hypothetical protein
MPRVGFEPMIPVFDRANTFHALDRGARVIGIFLYTSVKLLPVTPVVSDTRKKVLIYSRVKTKERKKNSVFIK